ncbi:MAG: TonB-dependent receptor [Saprospiraceae bacterium]|nr:TonB-dependent receptor [Saprospiraceae bacterium]
MMAQDRRVTGTIRDATGPLPGVNILVKGTSNGTASDENGQFELTVSATDRLVFSATGFRTIEVEVGTQSTFDILMEEDAVALEEVVVTGYSVETKRETTGAIAVIKAAELKAIPSGNVEQQLQGRVTGVTVITNGQPGTQSQIRVRGFNALGGNAPLYVVDGVPVASTDFLSPEDIETATTLKDAAAASIYGARAANGVIVYTTKQGKKGARKLQISYDGIFGVTDPNVNGAPEMLSPQEQADWTHIAYRNNAAATGTEPKYTHPQYGTQAQATLPDYLHANGQNGVRGSVDLEAIRKAYAAKPDEVFLIKPNLAGTNWYDEITRSAILQRHSLGFSGGGEGNRYYFGFSLQDQEGILLNNDFKRYTFRANTEFDLGKRVRIGENLQFTYRSVVGGFGGNGGLGGADDESVVLSAYRMPTVIPVYDEFGSFASTRAAGFNNPRNPVRQLLRNDGDDKGYNGNAFGNLYIEVDPIKNLTLRSSIGGQYNTSNFVNYGYRYLGDSEPEASNTFSEGNNYNFGWVFTNTASYKAKFGVHGFNVLAGIEALNTGAGRFVNGSGINPFSTDLNFVNLSTVQNPQVNSGKFNGVNFYSLFGKLDYNFNEKYYVTGVIRRDGSSRFGSNVRFGVFPAFSAAWRVTSEKFMSNIPIIDDLKFRVGWGEMGNSNNVDPANQFSLYSSGRDRSFYPIEGQNNGANEGFNQSRIGNPDAKWETTETTNFGFDLSMFNNRLEINAEVWRKDTRDLLYQVPLPGVVGNSAAAPSVNIASMRNQGVDLQIIHRGKIAGDWDYEVVLNNSFLKNEITFLAPGIEFFNGFGYRGINPIRNAVGEPISSFFGYKVIGYFQNAADVTSSPAQEGKGVGRFKYEDVNGDGAITPLDRTFIGSPVPDYTGGYTLNLSYKKFTLGTLWYASLGNEIFNMSKWFTDFFGSFEGSGKGVRAKESWTPERGNSAKAPIWESASNLSTNAAENSWYVENGSFLRLQQVAVSYDFAGNAITKMGLSRLRLGVAANNLFTITKYEGLDPLVASDVDTQFGIDVGNYPVTRSFTLTLSAGF